MPDAYTRQVLSDHETRLRVLEHDSAGQRAITALFRWAGPVVVAIAAIVINAVGR